VSFLTTLRKLVLGETWKLPAAVAVLLVLALIVRELTPRIWETAGGPLFLGGVIAALVWIVGSS
jgi:hypothetical protein